jgi:hypothetical protein
LDESAHASLAARSLVRGLEIRLKDSAGVTGAGCTKAADADTR